MAFSIKQLFGLVLVIAIGLVALSNADKPLVGTIAKQIVIVALILAAYGIWTSHGETRAFRGGFLAWGGLYFLLHVAVSVGSLNLGTTYLLRLLSPVLQPEAYIRDASGAVMRVDDSAIINFRTIGHCILTVLLGIVGGMVTVYFYHKRQRMLAENQPSA